VECFEVPIADAEGILPLIAAFHKDLDMRFPGISGEIHVKVNIPIIWHGPARGGNRSPAGRRRKADRTKEIKMLVEPYVEDFKCFNTNTGWAFEEAEIMQALSHFSYHLSEGNELLCDLQGEWLDPEKCHGAEHNYVLTSTSVMTMDGEDKRAVNAPSANLGAKGIENFFSKHRCNKFCCSSWKTWKNAKQHFRPCEAPQMLGESVEEVFSFPVLGRGAQRPGLAVKIEGC
jgi:hypothetical protein